MTLDDYVDTFELFDDWNERYQYLSELGEQLPVIDDSLRTEENKVQGCMSNVWVLAYLQPSGTVGFHADCDTSTIKGVLALVVDLMSEKSTDQALNVDVDEIFDRLELKEHLSPNRHFGIYAMVEMMKKQIQNLKPTD